MSSNFADPDTSTAAPARPAWSLTFWLTCLSSLASFVILAVISLLLYGGLAAQLNRQNHTYLHDEADIIERLLRSRANADALAVELRQDHSGDEYIKHYVRLMDRNGAVIMQTSSMEEALPCTTFPLPQRDGRPGVDRTWRTTDGRLFLVSAAWVQIDPDAGTLGVLQVAVDITNVDQILISYRSNIYILLALGLLLCVAVSYLIARRGTRPLREMAAIVRRISGSSLEHRIVGDNWPAEALSLAAAMNLMLDRLQESFGRLYTSATNLTHKLRTPLTILRGEAEMALAHSRSVEELQDVISSSLEEYARLSRLGDNILFLADAETGKFQANPAALDGREEIEKVLDFYGPVAEEKGVAVSFRGEATFNADPSLFRKALAVLLSNAITYSEAGGEVAISLCQTEDGAAELSVADTGCGIAAEETDKIFDRFYRVYGTRHRDPHGTGLGLPIARAIMDLHHGTLMLESCLGAGSTVTLRFPAPAAE